MRATAELDAVRWQDVEDRDVEIRRLLGLIFNLRRDLEGNPPPTVSRKKRVAYLEGLIRAAAAEAEQTPHTPPRTPQDGSGATNCPKVDPEPPGDIDRLEDEIDEHFAQKLSGDPYAES